VTQEILREARSTKNPIIALQATGRLERQLEFEARLLGELNDSAKVATGIRVSSLPDVSHLRMKSRGSGFDARSQQQSVKNCTINGTYPIWLKEEWLTLNRLLAGLALMFLLVILPAKAKAQSLCDADPNNIVLNCGFETGDFTDWTVNESANVAWGVHPSSIDNSGPGPNSGTYFASTGCTGAQCIGSDSLSTTNYLYQNLTTVAGDTYSVTFYFASGGEPGQELLATFGGTTLFDLVNLPGNAETGYTAYTTTVVASATTSLLEFQGRQDPAYNALDDISVDLVTGTPEPSSVAMLGCGLLGLVVLKRYIIGLHQRG